MKSFILSDENLRETFIHLQSGGKDMQQIAMAQEVLLLTLGPIWWEQHCNTASANPDKFLNQKELDDDNKFKWQHRISYLGHLLYALKNCKGFDLFIDSLKTRDLASCNWELSVAYRFLDYGFTVEFIKESGIKGSDYDLIVSKDGQTYPVEAKNRTLVENEVGLKYLLEKARNQLPKDSAGIIMVAVPEDWMINSELESTIKNIIYGFLNNTSRVRHIVLQWETWRKVDASQIIIKLYETFSARGYKKLQFKKLEIGNEVFKPSFWNERTTLNAKPT
jgi:hypothetical protein